MTFKDILKSIYKTDHLIAAFLAIYNLRYIINPNGHDYLAYYADALHETTGLPITYLINFMATRFGMNGLYLLSFVASILIYLGFYRKASPRIKPFVAVILFLNPTFQYMGMGVLQNLIAFAAWSCLGGWAGLVLPLIHLPTTVYFAIQRFAKAREFGYQEIAQYLALMLLAVLLNRVVPSNFFRTVFYVLKFDTWIKTAFFYGEWGGYLLVSTMILIGILLFDTQKVSTSAKVWIALYCLVFAYAWHWRFMARIVYISFFPLTNALIELNPSRRYLILLGLGFILV